MRNYNWILILLCLSACNGGSSTPEGGGQIVTPTSPVLPSPAPLVTPTPTPSSTPISLPCQDKFIPVGTGNSTFSVFIVSTSPSSSDQIFLHQDCTWNASWSDKTFNGGGTAYNASGTYSFSGNVITFQPSGFSYTIAEEPYRTNDPAYSLTLRNPDLLYPLWTGQNIASHTVHTGLAFQDWLINTDLQDSSCNTSQNAFNSCMNDTYNPSSNLNGKRSIFYRD